LNYEALPLYVNSLIIIGTIVLISKGAHYVIDSAVDIAKRLGISELVIGITVVAFGTSVPEFAVTLDAAFRGHGDISVGNIVGSNIFNLGFILGGCALLRSIVTSPALLRRDGTVLAISTFLLLGVVAWDLSLSGIDGVLLFVTLLAYLGYIFWSRQAPDFGDDDEHEDDGRPLWIKWTWLVFGLVCITGGSHLLVGSATAVAKSFGISEWIIGATVVAAATSAPELVVSFVAAMKKSYGISAGNLVGSSIFNILGVLGLAGMLRPVTLDPMARLSLITLSGLVLVVLLFIRTGWKVSRLEGLALFTMATALWWFDFSMRIP